MEPQVNLILVPSARWERTVLKRARQRLHHVGPAPTVGTALVVAQIPNQVADCVPRDGMARGRAPPTSPVAQFASSGVSQTRRVRPAAKIALLGASTHFSVRIRNMLVKIVPRERIKTLMVLYHQMIVSIVTLVSTLWMHPRRAITPETVARRGRTRLRI
jgi:hypothetical protein